MELIDSEKAQKGDNEFEQFKEQVKGIITQYCYPNTFLPMPTYITFRQVDNNAIAIWTRMGPEGYLEAVLDAATQAISWRVVISDNESDILFTPDIELQQEQTQPENTFLSGIRLDKGKLH